MCFNWDGFEWACIGFPFSLQFNLHIVAWLDIPFGFLPYDLGRKTVSDSGGLHMVLLLKVSFSHTFSFVSYINSIKWMDHQLRLLSYQYPLFLVLEISIFEMGIGSIM